MCNYFGPKEVSLISHWITYTSQTIADNKAKLTCSPSPTDSSFSTLIPGIHPGIVQRVALAVSLEILPVHTPPSNFYLSITLTVFKVTSISSQTSRFEHSWKPGKVRNAEEFTIYILLNHAKASARVSLALVTLFEVGLRISSLSIIATDRGSKRQCKVKCWLFNSELTSISFFIGFRWWERKQFAHKSHILRCPEFLCHVIILSICDLVSLEVTIQDFPLKQNSRNRRDNEQRNKPHQNGCIKCSRKCIFSSIMMRIYSQNWELDHSLRKYGFNMTSTASGVSVGVSWF